MESCETAVIAKKLYILQDTIIISIAETREEDIDRIF